MKQYTDENFYLNTYKGNMPEHFNRLNTRASAEVRKHISNRDITGYEEEVQMATCSVIDLLSETEKIQERKSKLISSESSDKVLASESVADYSRTFANVTNINDLDKEITNQKSKIKEVIRTYLLDTGLLYRGG